MHLGLFILNIFGLAKCLYEINKYGIKKMFYTTYNGFCEENLI